jgi:type VI secretion system protein ImpF
MAELTPTERLQPCLIDRLTDEEPGQKQETRDHRVMSLQRYRQAVLRDLSWLLNTSADPHLKGLDEFEEVPSSVLNYGVPDVTGRQVSGLDLIEYEAKIRTAVQQFEPRIDPESISVESAADHAAMDHRALAFEIRGALWAQPVPEQLFIRTEVDLETGQCELHRGAHG